MTMHVLSAPIVAGVTRWLLDPASTEIRGGRYLDRITGVWRDRGFKRWSVVFVLIEVKSDGTEGYRREFITAPVDGYIHGAPRNKRYFNPGETIAMFEEGYVYHWRYHDQKHRRTMRTRAVVYHKHPRVFYGLNLLIAILLGAIGYTITSTTPDYIGQIGMFMVWCAIPYTFFMGIMTLLGKTRGYQFLESWYVFKPFWQVAYALIGLGVMYTVAYLYNDSDDFNFMILPYAIISLMAIDSAIAGSWAEGPVTGRMVRFVRKRISL